MFGFKFGLSYQLAGTKLRYDITLEDGSFFAEGTNIIQQQFIKIPLHMSFQFGSKLIYGIDLGVYYNVIVANSLSTESGDLEGIDFIDINFLKANHLGLRLKPFIEGALNESNSLVIGILFEHALLDQMSLGKTRPYNLYGSIGIKHSIGN